MRWILLVALLQPAMVFAQTNWARAGTWEFILHPQYIDSVNAEFEGGSRAEVNEDYSFGFGMNYNRSQHLALGFDFSWSEANYNATRILDTNPQQEENIGGVLESATMAFNADFYLTDRAVAPFITGNLGWTFVDSNIPDGPPQGVCWWDPFWWAWVCGEYVPTKTFSEFTYGIGGGVRWDITRGFFLRGSVNERWVDLNKAKNDVSVTTVRIDLGFSLR